MSTSLAADWKDNMLASLQSRELSPDASFVVSVQISGVTADGGTTADWRAEAGWLTPTETVEEPEVVVAMAGKDAVQVVEGSVPFAVGFMRGKVKISGDPAASMALLRASAASSTA